MVYEEEIPTRQIIVKYKFDGTMQGEDAPDGNLRMLELSATAGMPLEYVREMSGEAHVIRLPAALPLPEVEKITERLAALPEVEYAEPDAVMRHFLTPNDPQYNNQWHYYETNGINLPAAWDITTGSSAIKVAVLDSGITDHADLSGRWVGGTAIRTIRGFGWRGMNVFQGRSRAIAAGTGRMSPGRLGRRVTTVWGWRALIGCPKLCRCGLSGSAGG